MPDARPRRLTPRVAAMLGSAGVLAVALSGCAGAPAPTPTPTVSASAAPIFASDEEALAAAEAAYRTYGATSAAIAADGGIGPERIDPTVTSEYAHDLHAEFTALVDAQLRTTGQARIDSISIAEWAAVGSSVQVTIYLCRDVTDVRIIDSGGVDVTPADRDNRIPTQVFLVSASEDPTSLIVDGVDRWSGEDFC
ncbi:MAG TPA: hypothetical protein VM430_14075 [Microbacterium sp.]|nr:hypothetical protein [Microbacterium sp.]